MNSAYTWSDVEQIIDIIDMMYRMNEVADRKKRIPRETKYQTTKFYNFRKQKNSRARV